MTTNTETLRAEPGIDVRRLKAGTQIIIETQSHVYEMKAVLPQSGLFEISSTDPPLHAPIVGKFTAGRCAGHRRGGVGRQGAANGDPLPQRLLRVGALGECRGQRQQLAVHSLLTVRDSRRASIAEPLTAWLATRMGKA